MQFVKEQDRGDVCIVIREENGDPERTFMRTLFIGRGPVCEAFINAATKQIGNVRLFAEGLACKRLNGCSFGVGPAEAIAADGYRVDPSQAISEDDLKGLMKIWFEESMEETLTKAFVHEILGGRKG